MWITGICIRRNICHFCVYKDVLKLWDSVITVIGCFESHSMSGQRDTKKPARIIHPSQQSILRLVWRELWYLLFALLLFLPAWLLIIILMPISWLLAFFLDAFMSVFLKESYPGFERVSPWDAIWLARTDPSTPPVSVCLLTLERGLTFQEIKGLILDRMVLAKDDSDNIMYRRFMQKITSVLGCYAFVYDGAFDPRYLLSVNFLMVREQESFSGTNLLSCFCCTSQ